MIALANFVDFVLSLLVGLVLGVVSATCIILFGAILLVFMALIALVGCSIGFPCYVMSRILEREGK